MTKMFIDATEKWAKETTNFDNIKIEEQISSLIAKYLLRINNRNPVVKVYIIVID